MRDSYRPAANRSEASSRAKFSHATGTTRRLLGPTYDSSARVSKRSQPNPPRASAPSYGYQQALLSGPHTHAAPSTAPTSRRTGKSGLNPYATLDDIQNYTPGMIIRVAQHATAQDPAASPSKAGFEQGEHAIIISKYRPAVVMQAYDNGSITILPMYTHRGNDLKGVKQEHRRFHMLVGNPGDFYADGNSTGNEPLYVDYMKRVSPRSDRKHKLEFTSSIDLSQPSGAPKTCSRRMISTRRRRGGILGGHWDRTHKTGLPDGATLISSAAGPAMRIRRSVKHVEQVLNTEFDGRLGRAVIRIRFGNV